MEIHYNMTPEFEELESRYNVIVKEIYAEASEQMVGTSLRSQQHIHRCAIERARPFVEEIGHIRGLLTTTVIIEQREALSLKHAQPPDPAEG